MERETKASAQNESTIPEMKPVWQEGRGKLLSKEAFELKDLADL